MKQSTVLRRFLSAGVICLGAIAWGATAVADDRDLLRFNTAKPYVFLLLDTSGSMTQAPDGSWLPASGDDPQSKIYQAKKALYDVFSNVDDIHVGFATFNQDELRVRAKHWLYSSRTSAGVSIGSTTYPDGGEVLTFGHHLGIGVPGVAGSCDSPLNLASERGKINRFPKLGSLGSETTTLWIREGSAVYRLTVKDDSGTAMGSLNLSADFIVDAVPDCGSPPIVGSDGVKKEVKFRMVRDFLMRDDETTPGSTEPAVGFWPWEDALSQSACEDGGPFSGDGWEGNYDSIFDSGDSAFNLSLTDEDPYCLTSSSAQCRNLKHTTVPSSIARELDRGDMLPLDWNVDNLETFLDRLAPNRADGPPDFGAASYFVDAPDSLGLALKNENRRPIIANGSDSPLGDAIADFRCWYRGKGANKCSNFGAPDGWENVAKEFDTEWGCRRPYLIVVADGANSCPGENPCADTANLFAKAGIRSWVITYGGSAKPPLSCIASNGRGELVFVDDGDTLADELRRVLGIIREEAAAFASAAAPSVQAIVDRSIYISTFTPLNNKSRWDGHLDSFLKPLPLDINGQPDRTKPQFQWDAGTELVAQAPDQATADTGNLQMGLGEDQRRVFYSVLESDSTLARPGEWPAARRAIAWTDDGTPAETRYDLWEGLEIAFTPDDPFPPLGESGVDQGAQDQANQVLSDTVAKQTHTLDDGTVITYVFGDVFHSDPLVLGSPANVRLFFEDAESDGTDCASGNPGYRCFFRKHQFRRKQLVVGSNDGQLHAFDAGRAALVTNAEGEEEVRFDEGTGNELFAYIPRAVLPTIRQLAQGSSHRFGVDSTPAAADVFIDPAFTGTPVEDEREFRTVLITGLREGGSAYFALDVTQPDKIGADGVPVPRAGAEKYVGSCTAVADGLGTTVPAGCGPVAYPSPLWEYNDSVFDPVSEEWVRMDEDLNGVPDLGDTWASVTIGRVQICDGANCDPNDPSSDVRDLWVAVFPGGMDAENKYYDWRLDEPAGDEDDVEPPPISTVRGDWLYMVDIETGQTVYKRQLLVPTPFGLRSGGAAPGAAAAVDTDQDGYLDRIYVTTLGGLMYRVDIGLDPNGNAPELVDQAVASIDRDPVTGAPITYTVPRIPLLDSAGNLFWQPRVLFDANFDGSSATVLPRPFYHEPAVLFVAELGLYALAIGTGDREDLWSGSDQPGRFYVFVDDSDRLLPSALPFTESSFFAIDVDDPNVGGNLLVGRDPGQRGWFLVLDADERVITDAFALSGVTFFSSFQPDIEVSSGRNPLCSKTGGSRIFIVNTTNANNFLQEDGVDTRFMSVAKFVTQPFTEQGSNPNVSSSGSGEEEPPPPTADDLTDQLRAVMEEMKKLFPSECKFANYRIDIKTLASDTGVVFIAPVPVCLIEKNWKEF